MLGYSEATVTVSYIGVYNMKGPSSYTCSYFCTEIMLLVWRGALSWGVVNLLCILSIPEVTAGRSLVQGHPVLR